FQTAPPYVANVEHDIVRNIIQVPARGRVRLQTGGVVIVSPDSAEPGGGSGFPELTNTGIGFAYVDHDVRNSFTYHYSVTAFDVNSFKSGPSSIESPRITKTVTPRKLSSNATSAQLVQGM